MIPRSDIDQEERYVVLVCGGRGYDDAEKVDRVLSFIGAHRIKRIVHGNAKGADTLADNWAAENGVTYKRHSAKWYKYGKRAGLVRNQKMLDEEDPDVVIAFPGGVGTADMVERGTKAGKLVLEVR